MPRVELVAQDAHGPRAFQAEIGETLFIALGKAGFEIPSICGGSLACGLCHVVIEGEAHQAQEPSDLESEWLEFSVGYEPGRSRLACQVEVSDGLRGVKVSIPEA